MLETRDLWYAYPGGPPALRGIDFSLLAGDFVALIGRNGSGKTTLVKHFNGLLRPTRGEVRLQGEDIRQRPVSALAHSVGYVFQNPDHQIFCPTVREEIGFGLRQIGIVPSEAAARAEEALARFGLQPYAGRPPATLSYGLRRKVTLAAVFAMRPSLWILDEPTTGLDRGSARGLMHMVRALHRLGHSILLITHDLQLVAEYAPRCLLMEAGQIVTAGPTRAVFKAGAALEAAGIELPQISRLALRLGASPGVALTPAELCEELAARARLNARP